MNVRTHALFAIGFLALTFGCKAGSIAKVATVAVAASRVAVAGAAVGAAVANASARGSRSSGRPPVEAVDGCPYVCPMTLDERVVYVCAEPLQGVFAADETGAVGPVYACR